MILRRHFTLALIVSVVIAGASIVAYSYRGVSAVGTSAYSAQIRQCLATPVAQRKQITDYTCPSGRSAEKPFDVGYQVAVSVEFHKIDQQIEQELDALKDMGAAPLDQKTRWISSRFDATSNERIYLKVYFAACDRVLPEVVKEFGSVGTMDKTGRFAPGSTSQCRDLALRKLAAYKESAWLLAGNQTNKVHENGLRDFMEKDRKQEEHVADIQDTFTRNANDISTAWPTFTPKVVSIPGSTQQ